MELKAMSKSELEGFYKQACEEYDGYKAKGLALNMARGKPSAEQLDLTEGLLTAVSTNAECYAEDGTDCRNYGIGDGLPEAKKLFAPMLGVSEDEIMVLGNSSLTIMYDNIAKFMVFGTGNGAEPWSIQARDKKLKWLCPVPGYDRHFLITEKFGFEMVNIPTDENGPDMDMIEKLVAEDDSIKGIWCVPMYANPTGVTYSDEVVKRLAAMKTAAKDFRIFWDNAYCIHHLNDTPDKLLNILDEAKKAGNEERVLMFASTSKVTYPGAGVAVMGAAKANIDYIRSLMTVQSIGPDKINQLRHVKFFKDFEGVTEHMKKHAALVAPRFAAVLDELDREIAPLGIAKWTKPNGGYFISFNAMSGCAKRICQLCKEAGVVLTGAGATFPYGKDPEDSNIRIAPTYPPIDELKTAARIFALATKIACAEKLLGK
ncbi:MAG: aminotransferase class I/II-fold pyridoxal phosphate-dependent enzyme [Ruminococcus sp.]|nr:aminotransferase class I/II-fold pyridoxal phosphate-dependent enzyme [Ruminococcus sp.]